MFLAGWWVGVTAGGGADSVLLLTKLAVVYLGALVAGRHGSCDAEAFLNATTAFTRVFMSLDQGRETPPQAKRGGDHEA